MMRLRHKNVVRLYGVVIYNDPIFIVTEFAEGQFSLLFVMLSANATFLNVCFGFQAAAYWIDCIGRRLAWKVFRNLPLDVIFAMEWLILRSNMCVLHFFLNILSVLFILAGHSSGSCSAQLFVGQEESCEDH